MVKLIYSDIAKGAAEDAAVTTTTGTAESTPDLLPFGADTGAVATCELNSWGLSHEFKPKGTQPFAFWSEEISGADCTFSNTALILIEFEKQYIASGLTLRFSPGANDYCSQITVVWYQNGVEKDRGTFYPDSPLYAVENAVEGFDTIVIYFNKTHLPFRRVKLEYIGIGIVREITGRDLKDAKFIHEIDYVSNTVPMNVLDAAFHFNTNAELIFQKKQPVKAYDADGLIGVYYIDKGERISSRTYKISCYDAIGILDLDKYGGGLWLDDTPIEILVADVIGGLFEYEIDASLQGKTLKGYIPDGITRREALQHIAFASGAVVDTSGTEGIRIFAPENGEGEIISPKETYQGGVITTSDIATSIKLASYSIVEGTDDMSTYPTFKYSGKEYTANLTTITLKNPNAADDILPNVVEYEGCYLVSSNNAQALAESLLAYHMRRNVYSAKHIVTGQKLADRVNVATPWKETKNANIIKMTISVSGLVASETEFLLD